MADEPGKIHKDPPKLLKVPKLDKRMQKVLGPAHSAEHLAARRAEAFRLRIDEGLTHQSIAKILDVSPDTIYKDLTFIAKMKYQGMIEKDELALLETNKYLDALIEKWLPLALSKDLVVGETREKPNGEIYDITLPVWESTGTATDKLLKALEMKAKINGFTGQGKNKSADQTGKDIAMAVYQAFSDLAKPKVTAVVVETKELPNE